MFTSSVRLQRCLPVLAASVLLLTGCGVADTQFHPGVAAQVGDDTITTKHVDQVTADYCTGVEKLLKAQTGGSELEPRPRRYLTQQVVNGLITRAATEQLAEDYDVQPSATFKSALANLDTQIETLSDDQRDALVDFVAALPYSQDVLTTIGGMELAKEGNSSATDDDKLAAGQDVLSKWVADHDVQVNPKYGIDFEAGAQIDTELSYAAGKTAKDGASKDVETAYAAALPVSQYCLLPPPAAQ